MRHQNSPGSVRIAKTVVHLVFATALAVSLFVGYLFAMNSFVVRAARAQKSGAEQSGDASKFDSSSLAVAPNLSAQIAKFRQVRMPFDSARLSPRERQLVS